MHTVLDTPRDVSEIKANLAKCHGYSLDEILSAIDCGRNFDVTCYTDNDIPFSIIDETLSEGEHLSCLRTRPTVSSLSQLLGSSEVLDVEIN